MVCHFRARVHALQNARDFHIRQTLGQPCAFRFYPRMRLLCPNNTAKVLFRNIFRCYVDKRPAHFVSAEPVHSAPYLHTTDITINIIPNVTELLPPICRGATSVITREITA